MSRWRLNGFALGLSLLTGCVPQKMPPLDEAAATTRTETATFALG